MLEQELKNIWRNSPKKEKIKFDLSRLMIEFNDRMGKFEKSFRTRDRLDLITAIISIPVFGYIAYVIPFPVTKIGVILAMIAFIWGIFERRHFQKKKLPLNPVLPFREQLEDQKANILLEINRYNTVLYWFLIPSFVPFAISILGLGNPKDYGWSNAIINQLLPMPLSYKIGNLVFAGVIFTAIYLAHKRAIRKQFRPLVHDIEKLKNQLDNDF